MSESDPATIQTGGGAAVESGVQAQRDFIGRDLVGRDRIDTQNIYAGLTLGEMYSLRLVLALEELWGLLEALAIYGRDAALTVPDVERLTARLRQWYFSRAGGMYLSALPASKEAYIALQTVLTAIRDANAFGDAESGDGDSTTRLRQPAEVIQRGSDLRHAIVADLKDYLDRQR
jgi:hypothetical protein